MLMDNVNFKSLQEYRSKIATKIFGKKERKVSYPLIFRSACTFVSGLLLFQTFLSFLVLCAFGASVLSLTTFGIINGVLVHYTMTEGLYYEVVRPLLVWGNQKLFVRNYLKRPADIVEVIEFGKETATKEYNEVIWKSNCIIYNLKESLDSMLAVQEGALNLPSIENRASKKIKDLRGEISSLTEKRDRLEQKRDTLLHDIEVSKQWIIEERNLELISQQIEALNDNSPICEDTDLPLSLESITQTVDADIQYILDYKEEMDS